MFPKKCYICIRTNTEKMITRPNNLNSIKPNNSYREYTCNVLENTWWTNLDKDQAVFTIQSPTGKAITFTFSAVESKYDRRYIGGLANNKDQKTIKLNKNEMQFLLDIHNKQTK